MPTSPQSSTGYRMRVLVSACLALVAQTQATLHTTLVQHTRCLEHGELVDADGEATHAVSDLVPRLDVATASAAREHDHCDIAALQSRRLQPHGIAITALPPPRVIVVEPAFVENAFASAARRLSLAPKTSPPLV